MILFSGLANFELFMPNCLCQSAFRRHNRDRLDYYLLFIMCVSFEEEPVIFAIYHALSKIASKIESSG